MRKLDLILRYIAQHLNYILSARMIIFTKAIIATKIHHFGIAMFYPTLSFEQSCSKKNYNKYHYKEKVKFTKPEL